MTETPQDGFLISLGIVNRGDDDAVTVVMYGCAPGSEPSASVSFMVKPDSPNSYTEWLALMSLFTEDAQALMAEGMSKSIERVAGLASPEEIAAAADATFETLRMNGWSAEEAADAARDVVDLGGGA